MQAYHVGLHNLSYFRAVENLIQQNKGEIFVTQLFQLFSASTHRDASIKPLILGYSGGATHLTIRLKKSGPSIEVGFYNP